MGNWQLGQKKSIRKVYAKYKKSRRKAGEKTKKRKAPLLRIYRTSRLPLRGIVFSFNFRQMLTGFSRLITAS